MFGRKTYHVFLIFLLFFCFTNNAQDRPINQKTPLTVVGDFHRQDNIRYATGYNKLDWYGSGDVNNDEKIDNDDLNSIVGSTSYRADVDGDGTPGTANDELTLKNFLTGVSDYLPGHWDELQTPEERVSWLEKMISIEREIREGQTYTQDKDSWISLQSFINFNGISDISNYIKRTKNNLGVTMDSTANGLFNIPVRYLVIMNEGGQSDATNLQILEKDNPLDVTNYYSFDPKTGQKISLNKILNYDYVMVGATHKYGSGEEDFTFTPDLVKFKIENNQQKEINYMYNFVLRNSPRKSNINLTAPEDITIDKTAYESNPDLLSDFYGVPNVTSNPPEGQDFYWTDPNLDPAMTNQIKGEIKNEVGKSIVDTTYLNPDSTMFSVKKKFVGTQHEINHVGRTDVGYWGASKFNLDKDSVYQTITVDLTTGVENEEPLEKNFSISQNYPNPFNPITNIKFSIPNSRHGGQAQFTILKVYDVLGREVKTLINESLAPGAYEVKFNGSELPSGVYFYRLTSGNHTQTRKMMLLK